MTERDVREALAEVLAKVTDCMECEGTGRSRQGWSANYGDQFGPCQVCTRLADALLASDAVARIRAEALREVAREARERGDIGKEGGCEAWDWLEIRAEQAAGGER